MPTRRIMGLMVAVAILVQPAWGLVRLWIAKTLATEAPDSTKHKGAQVGAVAVG